MIPNETHHADNAVSPSARVEATGNRVGLDCLRQAVALEQFLEYGTHVSPTGPDHQLDSHT